MSTTTATTTMKTEALGFAMASRQFDDGLCTFYNVDSGSSPGYIHYNGIGRVGGSCGKDYNASLVALHKKSKSVTSTIGTNNNNDLLVQSVPEDKDLPPIEDEYVKYDPEPNADQLLINSGATIIRSEIQLTDSSGGNRILVRRNIR